MTIKRILLLTAFISVAVIAQAEEKPQLSASFQKALEGGNARAAQVHRQKNLVSCPECGRKVEAGSTCSNHHKKITVTGDVEMVSCSECGRKVIAGTVCHHGHKPTLVEAPSAHHHTANCQSSCTCSECTEERTNTSADKPAAQENADDSVVHTCSFCGEPILEENHSCSSQHNPFGICTYKDMNTGRPLYQGDYSNRFKDRFYVPYESQIVKK